MLTQLAFHQNMQEFFRSQTAEGTEESNQAVMTKRIVIVLLPSLWEHERLSRQEPRPPILAEQG